jgi:hypothetical protein
MHTDARRALLRQLVSAGAFFGVLGLAGFESVQAEDNPEGGRFFRRNRFGYPTRKVEARPRLREIQLVENQEDTQPRFERADEKARPPEESDQHAPGQAHLHVDEKAAPPEEPPPADAAPPAEEPPPEPWALTNLFDDAEGKNTLKDWGVHINGHSQWGYSSAPDGAFTGNGPLINQQEWGQFNLNQQYLFVEKIADGKKGFGWGFRGDVMYGVDGNEGQSFGNVDPSHWDYLNGYDHGSYEWAFPQLYGEVAYGNLSIKGGHFYTIVGYEVVPSTGQFFFSRQLTFWNSEPFTHTGALATYKVNDKLTVSGGWVFGMDTGFYQYQAGNAFLGGLSYQIDEKTTFVYSVVAGNLGWRGDGAINSWILSRQWTKKFTTVHQFDVLATNLETGAGRPVSFANPDSFTPRNSTGFINYAFYSIFDWLKAGLRAEWFKADGTSYYTMTGGFNIKPKDWLLIRPEVRGMWSPGNQMDYTGVHNYNAELFNQVVFGIDAIVIF